MTKNVSTAIEADVIVAPNHALTNYQKKKRCYKSYKVYRKYFLRLEE